MSINQSTFFYHFQKALQTNKKCNNLTNLNGNLITVTTVTRLNVTFLFMCSGWFVGWLNGSHLYNYTTDKNYLFFKSLVRNESHVHVNDWCSELWVCVSDNYSSGGAVGADGGATSGAGGGDEWFKRRAHGAERASSPCARLTGPNTPSQGESNHSFLPSYFLN